MTAYNQLCCVHGITDELHDLKHLIEDHFEVRVKMADAYYTLPDDDDPDTGGRRDVLFYVHDEDVMKFAIPRLQLGIRWWEDVLANGHGIIPQDIKDKYPNTWEED